QFLQGVAFLHEHKIAQRDLKPGNVVVKVYDEQLGQLFIIDFDLAEFIESEETMIEGRCGTRTWIAPEVGTKERTSTCGTVIGGRAAR
ncbi:kinase-like domain-containing protein, partial [Russula dissimulans]